MCDTTPTKNMFQSKAELSNFCLNLINQHLAGVDIEFKLSTTKNALGICKYQVYNGIGGIEIRKLCIEISHPIAMLNPIPLTRETVLHEIAHAIDVLKRGYTNHDNHWRAIALSIGSNGERTTGGKEVKIPQAKYTLTCPNCGRTKEAHRLTKRLKNIACGRCCNGVYQEKYKFKISKNF